MGMRLLFVVFALTLAGCVPGQFTQGLKTSRDVLRAACKAEKLLTNLEEGAGIRVSVGEYVVTASASEDLVTVTVEIAE